MEKTHEKKYTIREIGDYYNRVMPEVVKSIAISDTMQAYRPVNIHELHNYIIETAELRDGQTIFDAGCGLGGPARYFASKLDVRIFSWTNSFFTFQYFSDKLADERAGLRGKVYPSLSDYHTAAQIFPPKTFDRVIFLESFLHSPAPLQLLRDIHGLLKDDGILYMKEMCSEESEGNAQQKKIERAIQIGADHFKYHYLTPAQLKSLLEEAGFEVLISRKPPFELYIDLGDQYLKELVQLDFFEGSEPVDWSECCEFKCIKRL